MGNWVEFTLEVSVGEARQALRVLPEADDGELWGYTPISLSKLNPWQRKENRKVHSGCLLNSGS